MAFGVIGAYDVGLDHSDRLGRFSRLDFATSYAHDDVLALFQMYVHAIASGCRYQTPVPDALCAAATTAPRWCVST